MGIFGQYDGTVNLNQWHRLAFTFDLGESNPTLKKYIDGVKVEEQALGSGQDGRWSIDSDAGFLVLADENREINPGYSSSIFFSDRIFPDEEIQALGTPDADGVINTPTSNQASQFDFLLKGVGTYLLVFLVRATKHNRDRSLGLTSIFSPLKSLP